MDKKLTGKPMQEYDFWSQREAFLNSLERATQTQEKFARVQGELTQLYEHTLVVKTTSKLLRTKLVRTLNKYRFL